MAVKPGQAQEELRPGLTPVTGQANMHVTCSYYYRTVTVEKKLGLVKLVLENLHRHGNEIQLTAKSDDNSYS